MDKTEEEKNKIMNKELLTQYIKLFSNNDNLEEELEIRFGTKGIKKISRNNFDNVIQYLKSKDFSFIEKTETLKIQPETLNKGVYRLSNVRFEINGIHNIQKYCKSNSLNKEGTDSLLDNIKIQQKKPKYINNNKMMPINFNNMNFRVSYQEEKQLNVREGFVNQIINDWNNLKKVYRYIVRYSYQLTNNIRVDLSIVKSSSKNEKGYLQPTYKILDSNVFNNVENYEIELEVIKPKYSITNIEKIIENEIKTHIKYILSGLQETNYPVSYDEIKEVSKEYYKLIYGTLESYRYLKPNNFIGPSSISLELKHIQNNSNYTNIPNIRTNYCITDKADGLRKLLFINSKGKIYLINTMMEVQFTGQLCKNKELFNSLLDGEHILYNKNKQFINLYAIFDIYFINGVDKRDLKFIKSTTIEEDLTLYRHYLMKQFVDILELEQIATGGTQLQIKKKNFYININDKSIFDKCYELLEKMDNNMFEYETDGIIFTPINLGVGFNDNNDKVFNYKRTWIYSLKWKPVEYNSVDFLVSTKKTSNNEEIISNLFETGVNVNTTDTIKQFKTLVLRVGYNDKIHGYINPCSMIINDEMPEFNIDSKGEYKPVPFYPTNPTDNNAHICNILLKGPNNAMLTEDETESFEDNTIVEFRYDINALTGWKWIPIRVRYDKTAEFRAGIKNYGNAYHVANSVWNSIHNPITKEMLITGRKIPNIEDDDVYYNRSGVSLTRPLRDFHNLYVKRKLINSVSNKGDILYDLAVGKAGDLSKWIQAELSFVFGVDVARDNIENKLDGACARYLNYKKENKIMPDALFVNANSSLNIKDKTAAYTEKGKNIIDAVFGVGSNDETILGKGVSKHYGIGRDGFNIVSCQFALHYFFENKNTLHNFLRNVSDGCKVGGYFIGTCYDGKEIFKKLKNKKQNESIIGMKEEHKLYEIIKKYDNDEFKNNETSIGYRIDVYQETINKVFKEYLVNFDYLTQLLESYGFVLLNKEEYKKIGMPNSSGSFRDLYNNMKKEIIKDKTKTLKNEIGRALELDNEIKQKTLSYLNRYFIYKKINNVDTKNIMEDVYGIKDTVLTYQEKPEEKEQEKPEEKEEEEKEEEKTGYIPGLVRPPVAPIEEETKLPYIPESSIDKLKKHNLSIIVPFRDQPLLRAIEGQDRLEHKKEFIEHMKEYIPKLKEKGKEYGLDLNVHIHFAIQSEDGRKFNRGALLNSGYMEEKKKYNPDTVIFHDVDLLPTESMLDKYVKPLGEGKIARHLVHKWGRYGEAGYSNFGGITLFNSKYFEKINGYPNYFEGWGGEDDALRNRIVKLEKLENKDEALTKVIEYPELRSDAYIDLENISSIKEKRKILKKDEILDNKIKKENLNLDKIVYKVAGLTNSSSFGKLYKIIESKEENNIEENIYEINENMRDYEVIKSKYIKPKKIKVVKQSKL
jgi:hypothetical protein